MRLVSTFVRTAALASAIAAAAPGQSAIPVRKLTPPITTDTGLFRIIIGAHPLSNGSLITNDLIRRRVLMFDSTLAYKTIADTAAGAPNKYPNTLGSIIPFLGDSTLFVDREAQVLVVIDPAGAFGRTMAMPKARDLTGLISPGSAAADPQGRLVYRVSRPTTTPFPTDTGKIVTRVSHDSGAIVHANFDTRTVDTIATFGLAIRKDIMLATTNGRAGRLAENPLPQTDDWTMLPDGTIAIVRGSDYHVDFVHPDGSRTSSPKLPFDWKRITDEDKQRILDSTKAAAERRQAVADSVMRASTGGARAGGGASAGAGGRGGGGVGGGGRGTGFPQLPFMTVDLADLPDYYPPIRLGTVTSDPDGNVWILPTTSVLAAGGLTYDLVSGKGTLVERVQLPPQRSLLAVGRGGVVYMMNTTGNVIRLERATIIR